MNRCIQCYRCVRYYRDYAGGKDFNVFGAHDHVYFGRAEDGVLENEFSGNLVEVCPTGVFTDNTSWKHYTRKWDLTTAPSICTNCSIGCNTIPGERYGMLRRILSRYNGQVNGYFLCDRGRFGYGYVNSDKRIRQVSIRGKLTGALETADVAALADYLKSNIQPGKIIGIGSPRASLESNFALRELVGKENFYSGIPEKELNLIKSAINILKNGPVRTPSLKETESADSVIILGEDITNTAPMLALAIRQTAYHKAKEVLTFSISTDQKGGLVADAAFRSIRRARSNLLHLPPAQNS
jgi:NADH-quinone oxidoreductase subunit G